VSDVKNQFIDYMRSEGVSPADPSQIIAGQFSRFDLEGETRGKKSGFCIFFDDEFPNGEFGSLKVHNKSNPLKWKPKHEAKEAWSDEQRQAYAKLQRERTEARKAALTKLHSETAELCRKWWNESKPVDAGHAYLERKGVRPHNLRAYKESLMVPVIIDGQLRSLQFIQPDGSKKFKKGGEIQGGYSIIGGKPDKRAVICEGWATGATIHEVTGLTVFVAFDAGNLEPVAKAIRAKFPELEFLIACDDDRFTTQPMPNPGLHYANKAASAAGAIVRRPVFRSDEGKPTDFNDLAAQLGNDEVRHQILNGKPTFEPTKTEQAVERKRHVDLMAPFPHVNGKGRPLGTIENVKELIDRLGVTVRYNIIAKTDEILIPNESFTIDNAKNASLAKVISWCNLAAIPTGNIDGYLTTIADNNVYNPVVNWVTSKPWDGKSRLPEFYNTIVERGEFPAALKQTLMMRWMISAVAAAFEPRGISAHGMLVFQGVQNAGKTSWFKKLAPKDLEVISDGKMLDLREKDSVYQVLTQWIVELGELDATFKKSDLAQLKAFITKQDDVIRKPFDRKESRFARKTVFFASVNKEEFLMDETGNRRYWVIPVMSIDYNHTIDMQQVWAEVYETLYKRGVTWYLNPEEIAQLNESNLDFQALDPIEERLVSHFSWDKTDTSKWRQVTASQALKEAGLDRPSQGELNRASAAIKKLSGMPCRRSTGGKRLLWVPPDPNADTFQPQPLWGR
jgi:putative DNA primase/helicase